MEIIGRVLRQLQGKASDQEIRGVVRSKIHDCLIPQRLPTLTSSADLLSVPGLEDLECWVQVSEPNAEPFLIERIPCFSTFDKVSKESHYVSIQEDQVLARRLRFADETAWRMLSLLKRFGPVPFLFRTASPIRIVIKNQKKPAAYLAYYTPAGATPEGWREPSIYLFRVEEGGAVHHSFMTAAPALMYDRQLS